MPTFRDLLDSLPSDTQEMLRTVWESLPSTEREILQSMFKGFPNEANLMRLLINLAQVQFKYAFGKKQKVAIIGPANVGKSTLYNHLIRLKTDRAEVSPLPGTTRANQTADAGLFSVVDTPGADAVGEVGEREKEQAMSAAQEADFLIILFDAIQGVKRTEHDLFEELKTLEKPYIVVLNKIDLVGKDSKKVAGHVAENLQLKPEQVISISAKEDRNTDKVLMAVALTEPSIVASLGRALPAYRWQLSWRVIVSAASISAVIALTPLPFIDFIPLITTQSVMVLGIARIYSYNITLARARELAITFGLGFVGRTLFQELSKFGGIPGWVLSAAIASSTTVVMGYAAAAWFEKGEKLSGETLRSMTRNLTTALLASLRDLGKNVPNKETLQQRISESLSKTSLSKSPALPDVPPEEPPPGESQTAEDTHG
ncbi:MAG: GTP-binding protein [Chloroflexi bacterium]|nr:GTP-binding protein [Chloroflexota bacterium]